ncbi:MAG: magnesium transporter [Myxococcota bacterium]
MATTPLNTRTETILRRLVRREAGPQVRKVLAKTRPEDVAAAMDHMTASERASLFRLVEDRETAASILTNLSDDALIDVVDDVSEDQLVDMLERMEMDDATDVVESLPDALRGRVLAELRGSDTDEVSILLSWPSDSAGGIMSPSFFTMSEASNCGRAIQALQDRGEDYDSVFYVYVIDPHGRLGGVVSLRQLLTHPPSTALVSIMTRDVIAVGPRQDQEEVARYVARYDLLAIPVVDEHKRVLGIVTVDDVIDVIREEAVEDMMLLAGVNDDISAQGKGVFALARNRAGWLLATIGGGVLAAELIGVWEDTLAQVAVLAGFIPVIMGMGGNVGIQSATITVRGIATGHVQLGGALSYIFREVQVGVVLGLLYGVLLGGYGVVRYLDQPLIGVSVGLSVGLAIVIASLFGTATPVVLSRMGVDPAVATGPFVTTVVDLVGIAVYFGIATALLPFGS